MSLHAIAMATGMPRSTLRTTLKDLTPASYSAGGAPRYTMDQVEAAMASQDEHATGGSNVSMAEARRRRELETLRKLKLANDTRAGLLIDRRWVIGQLTALCSRWHALRLAVESELPLVIQGKDIPSCRQAVKAEMAKLGAALADLGKLIEEEPKV